MKKLLIFIFVFVFANICHAQTKNFSFPEDAVGNYKGILQIDSPRGKQEIPMEFQLIKTDSIDRFEYKLIYSDQPRNYTLIIKDREKGICEVDENNGIILPSRFSGNTLFSFFEVQGNFLSSRFEFHKDKLFFEILFSAIKNKTTTGGTSKEIPEVFGYPITVIQKAELKKVN